MKLEAPTQGAWPDFHLHHEANIPFVEGHHYRASFWARAEPARELIVSFYQPGQPYFHLGGPATPFQHQIELAADAGVNFVSFQIPLPWPEPGQAADWAGVDALCRTVLRSNPQALLLPRIGMDPPLWWCKAHPDEVMRWEDGPHGKYAVPASPIYRSDAAERLTALIEHLEQAFGDHVAGYHPIGQNTGEWFYEATWKRPVNGYAPADLAAWREWLRQRYGTDEKANVPTPAERHASPAGVFRDPLKERRLIDWAEFQQQKMAECVNALAHAARQASHGKKLVVFFYGYLFEFSGAPDGPAVSGHYALRQVLDGKDIDVLCSPISYFDRGLGGGAPSMTAAESVALAGKLWLNEDDTHTYLASGDPPGSRDHVDTVEKTLDELTRNVAEEALRNFGTWWMDLGSSGWFNDARLWARMAELHALDDPLLEHPTPFRPEIAAIVDERSMLAVTEGGAPVSGSAVGAARKPLGRVGAPYGQYLLDDVLAGRVQAKLYVVLNAWTLSPAERARLREATRGAVVVECYHGPELGVSGATPDELTDFSVQKIAPQAAWATPSETGRKLGLTASWGVRQKIDPLFGPSDAASGEILATYPDGSAAVALRRGDGGASLFVGAPALTSELLRIAAREAGVHLFTAQDCNVYANGPFVAMHADHDGTIDLDTGKVGMVRDLLTGKILAQTGRLRLDLHRGETRILRCE